MLDIFIGKNPFTECLKMKAQSPKWKLKLETSSFSDFVEDRAKNLRLMNWSSKTKQLFVGILNIELRPGRFFDAINQEFALINFMQIWKMCL